MTSNEILDSIKPSEIPIPVQEFAHTFLAKSQKPQSYSDTTIATLEFMTPPFRNYTSTKMVCPSGAINISCRKFHTRPFPQDDLLVILGKSFTKSETNNHRAYASAGGLYPVIPLLVVLDNNILEGISEGVYGIDLTTNILVRLNLQLDFKKICTSISPYNSKLVNSVFLCYTFSLERTLIKYGIRGIRHTFIEIGEMSQAFRLFGKKTNPEFGDVSWSGFDDTKLATALGLKKLHPGMIQFFGLKNNDS